MKGKANPVATPKPLSQPAAVSAPASLPPLTPADHMLTSTTVSMPPPPKPQDTQPTLSVDPYREPIE